MQELLDLADGRTRRPVAAGTVLIAEGAPLRDLYVLVEGTLQVEKAGTTVATIGTPGACIGEMALLLDVPATATVRATTDAVVAVVEDAPALVAADPALALALARLVAGRLQVMTSYLADLKAQYADHEGGLGMIDTVLGSLLETGGTRTELRSARDPDPEY
jgi:CRP/FNR family transcriptional regulator, cyclic AMP receptor protein